MSRDGRPTHLQWLVGGQIFLEVCTELLLGFITAEIVQSFAVPANIIYMCIYIGDQCVIYI